MKKIKAFLVAAVAVVTAFVQAATEIVDGIEWTYTVTYGKASIESSYDYSPAIPKFTSGAITIPSTLGGYSVTSIGDRAFSGCSSLTSVTIPNSVTSIGYSSFWGCSSLTSITIPDSVTNIGGQAFSDCSSLTSITIPDSVTNIGSSAFWDCSSLMSVMIPDSVTSIGWQAFSGCSSLTSITIPDSVTSIGNYAFWGCSSLTSVTIPDSVTSIGDSSFWGCSSLMSVMIPDSVTSIGDSSFSGCSSLMSVMIPDSVTSIGWQAFYNCSSLTSITIPDSVTSIGDYAFWGCSSLTSVTIPDSVTSIGYEAFRGCSSLTSITIPDSVTNIGGQAFWGCSSLYDKTTIPGLILVDGWVVDCETSLSGDLNLTGIRGIGSSAFYNCSSLTSVTIPDSVTSIGYEAFSGCSSLTSITIPDSVTNIGGQAFSGCSGLADSDGFVIVKGVLYDYLGEIGDVVIPHSVTSIGNHAFYNKCDSLTSVTIPDTVTSIGEYAFDGCSSLYDKTTISGLTLVDGWVIDCVTSLSGDLNLVGIRGIGNYAFRGCSSLTSVTIPDSVTSIGWQAFYNCSSLTSVTIPDSVTSIGYEAFSGCSSLYDKTTIPGLILVDGWVVDCETSLSGDLNLTGIRGIGSSAFWGCSSLTSVTLTGDVKEIPENAFAGCKSLKSFKIPNGVVTIRHNAFEGCSSLTNVEIPNGLTTILPNAFKDCSLLVAINLPDTLTYCSLDSFIGTGLIKYDANGLCIVDGWLLGCNNKDLSSLIVPEGVVGIGGYALAEMYNLKTVTLPNSLKYINGGVFSGCSYLDNLTIPSNVEVIGSRAFENCSYLQTLTVDGVRVIDADAFTGCSQLSSVVFKDGLEEIRSDAFANCWRMQSISLPITVTNVAETAFSGCLSLTGITVPTGVKPLSNWFRPIYQQIKDVNIPKGEERICENMFNGCTNLVNVIIPSGIKEILTGAFKNCSSLEAVSMPETVEALGDDAFRGCSKLKTFVMPEKMSSVGASAFRDCSNLEDISLSRNLTALPDYVFYETALDSITVPATVTRLGKFIVSTATTDIYYMGNAPSYVTDSYGETSSLLTTWVMQGTLGWDGRPNSRDLPFKWLGHDIKFWTVNRFDVAFDANGGMFAPVSSSTYACEQTTYTWYALPPFEPTRPGYIFDGYWTEVEGGTRILSTKNVKLTKAHTLYAHWEKGAVVKVKFNANGGTVTTNEMEFGAGGTFGNLPVPTREHHIFEGWYTEATGGVKILPSSEVPAANRELFAHWTPKRYVIRYHANNGTDLTTDQSFTYGDTVVLNKNMFSLSGCVFSGWALSAGGIAVYADGKTLTDLSAVRDGVIHLYATWVGNTYSVRFDSHGGVGRMDDQTFVIGVAQELIPCAYTRSGFKFVGWALSTTAAARYKNKEKVKNLSTVRNATVTLYAVWEVVTTPTPTPTPTPNPSKPELGNGNYDVAGDKLVGAAPENAASVYDGYLYLDNVVMGTIQAKVAKPKKGVGKLTVTIQIIGEKKLTLKGELDLDIGEFIATDKKSDRTLILKLGLDGISGTFGKYDIDGARNFFDSKDKSEKSTAEEILKPYLGAYSMICDDGILSVAIAKKGKVTIKGNVDGNKVSAKAQALIGEKMICIPVIYSKKSVNLAFTIWLPIDGGEAEIIGLDDAIIGKAGTLKNGAKFVIDGDIGDFIETEDARTLELLPENEIITVSKSKWLVADGIKPAKVAYKKGEFTITEGKKGAGIVNPSGLKLSYKSKDGSFTGSFTAYAIVKGKLKKHKATVEGILIGDVGYGTITIKKIGTWAVTIK